MADRPDRCRGAIAWLLAAAVLHHQQARFAPIGAVIAVKVTRGQRVRHAIELVLGVTLGIGVAARIGDRQPTASSA